MEINCNQHCIPILLSEPVLTNGTVLVVPEGVWWWSWYELETGRRQVLLCVLSGAVVCGLNAHNAGAHSCEDSHQAVNCSTAQRLI